MRMSLILLKSVETLKPFIIMENTVKPGELERFSEAYNSNMLENHNSYNVLDVLKAERNRAGT